MNDSQHPWEFLRPLTWAHVVLVAAVLVLARLLSLLVRWFVRYAAESAHPRLRLLILRLSPIARLMIDIAAVVVIVPILVEPNFDNVITFLATISLALAFALKDFVSSIVGGLLLLGSGSSRTVRKERSG